MSLDAEIRRFFRRRGQDEFSLVDFSDRFEAIFVKDDGTVKSLSCKNGSGSKYLIDIARRNGFTYIGPREYEDL